MSENVNMELERVRLVDHFFSAIRPDVCADDFNISAIRGYIDANGGIENLNLEVLQGAVQALGSQLHYYRSAETEAQLQAGALAQQQLVNEAQDRKRKAAIKLHQENRQNFQDASGPGAQSAYSGQREYDLQEAKQRVEARSAAERNLQHLQFLSELRDANNYCFFTPLGQNFAKSQAGRDSLKAALRNKFPQFAKEVNA